MLRKSLMFFACALLICSCSKNELSEIEDQVVNIQKTGEEEDNDQIEEFVVDDSGNPVGGATVRLDFANGQHVDVDVTDSRGYYSFDNLSSGVYKVTERPNTGNEHFYYRTIN